ncbi:MAG: cytochrome P450 [Solirubrobacterales bacterium]
MAEPAVIDRAQAPAPAGGNGALRPLAAMPGPKWPPVVQSLVFLSNPVRFAEWARRRYGPVFHFRSAVLGDMVYVSDPAIVKQIFTGDPHKMRAGAANQPLKPVTGPHSILLLDGERHMRMRKLMLPPFHGEAIEHYGELISEIAEREIDRFPIGRPFAIRDHTQAITLDVIIRAVFGIDEAERQRELRRILPVLLDLRPSVVFERTRIDLGPRSPWGRFVRAKRRTDEILYDEMARRRERGDSAERDDVFSLLLAARDEQGNPLSDEELRDELLTLLAAGHETTATALAWVFERLVRHPDKMARLREDITSGAGSYLEATIKETLRVRPVIMDVGRKTSESVELAGYEIPPGIILTPSIGLVHLLPEIYPDPHEFRPERFLGEGAPEPYTWIPFGGGVRRCIGAAFAQYEMQLVIPAILRRVDLRAARSKPERQSVRGVTLAPSRGGEVIASKSE